MSQAFQRQSRKSLIGILLLTLWAFLAEGVLASAYADELHKENGKLQCNVCQFTLNLLLFKIFPPWPSDPHSSWAADMDVLAEIAVPAEMAPSLPEWEPQRRDA